MITKTQIINYIKSKIKYSFIICFLIACEPSKNELLQHYTNKDFNYASLLCDKDSFSIANHYLDSLYATFPYVSTADRIRILKFKCENYLYYYSKYKNNKTALAYADTIINLITEKKLDKKLPSELAHAYYLKATILDENKEFDKSLTAINQTRFIAEEHGDSCNLGKYFNSIGSFNFRQSNYVGALENFKKGIYLSRNCALDEDHFARTQGAYNNIGSAFAKLNLPDSALKYYTQAKAYIEKNKAVFLRDSQYIDIALSMVFVNISELYTANMNIKSAIEFYKKNVDLTEKINADYDYRTTTLINLANLYIQNNESGLAENLLNIVGRNLTVKNDYVKLNFYKVAWILAKKKNDINSELEYSKKLYTLKDSLDKSEMYLGVSNPELKYEQLEKKNELELLNKDNLIQKTIITVSIIIVLLLIFLAFVFLRNLLQTRKQLSITESLNKDLIKREAELEKVIVENKIIKEKRRKEEMFLQELKLQMEYNNEAFSQRSKISEDMHTGLSNSLTALKFYLGDLKNNANDVETKTVLTEIEHEVATINRNATTFRQNLNKNDFKMDYNLVGFLKYIAQKFAAKNLMELSLLIDEKNIKQKLSSNQLKHLNHIIREIISNAIKHSNANYMHIDIHFESKKCFFECADNGKGFELTTTKEGMGLNSIKNRMREIGGTFDIKSDKNGTIIRGHFPCK